MNEILQLLRENNAMLKEILIFLNQHERQEDLKQFVINVVANIFVEMLEPEAKERIKNNIKDLL